MFKRKCLVREDRVNWLLHRSSWQEMCWETAPTGGTGGTEKGPEQKKVYKSQGQSLSLKKEKKNITRGHAQ